MLYALSSRGRVANPDCTVRCDSNEIAPSFSDENHTLVEGSEREFKAAAKVDVKDGTIIKSNSCAVLGLIKAVRPGVGSGPTDASNVAGGHVGDQCRTVLHVHDNAGSRRTDRGERTDFTVVQLDCSRAFQSPIRSVPDGHRSTIGHSGDRVAVLGRDHGPQLWSQHLVLPLAVLRGPDLRAAAIGQGDEAQRTSEYTAQG